VSQKLHREQQAELGTTQKKKTALQGKPLLSRPRIPENRPGWVSAIREHQDLSVAYFLGWTNPRIVDQARRQQSSRGVLLLATMQNCCLFFLPPSATNTHIVLFPTWVCPGVDNNGPSIGEGRLNRPPSRCGCRLIRYYGVTLPRNSCLSGQGLDFTSSSSP
jgi:hypothetical protein